MVDLFNTGVRPAIDQWLLDEAAKKRDYGDYWSASSAGYCQRKLIFERLGVPKIVLDGDARKQRVFTSGHLFHEWIQGITKAAGLSIAQEVELQDEDLMVRGHFDDLVLLGERIPPFEEWIKKTKDHGGTKQEYDKLSSTTVTFQPDGTSAVIDEKCHLILYDYKTRNSRSFNFAKTPSHFHKMQLGTYMYMLRKGPTIKGLDDNTLHMLNKNGLTESRSLNIEKDTLRMAEVQYLWSDELEKEVVDYWTELNAVWKSQKMPPCTCADHENGFLAKEAYNGYFKYGEPCSLQYYKEWKEGQDESSK